MKPLERPVYTIDITPVLEAYKTSPQGLDEVEAKERQRQYGSNALRPKRTSLFRRIVEPFANAFVVVLLAALVLSLIEGKRIDAVIIAVIVGVNALIYYFQQFSVSRVLKTLREQDVLFTNVLRDGRTIKIPSDELTYGDIVHIEEGIKVPADGRLIEANQIQADEAMLTGESLPVHKHAAALAGERKVYDQQNMLFKGTYVKAGSGKLLVTGIGNKTELGSITALAGSADLGRSPIEHKIDELTRKLIFIIAGIAIVALALALFRGIAIEEALRFSLVIVVSAVPEGLPVALAIVLLLSARRMAKVRALVKKISSIETMGAITLIATDKTGTITQNKLTVAAKHTTHASAHTFDEVILASTNGTSDHAGDSLDILLRSSVPHITMPSNWQKIREFAFNQQLRVSGVLWKHNQGYSLFIKGAPEHILSHCGVHHRNDLKVQKALENFTGRGYRTIAFAHKDFVSPPTALKATALSDMAFDGFVGMADQLRPRISDAVVEAQKAGVKVVMLTGDHVSTAGFIGKEIGIVTDPSQIRDSSVLANGTAADIRNSLQWTSVFGRVLPEHKFALLKATKKHQITAMTGDGVNDIPALIQADVGIAMGSGTDAAKDASDIVLLDNNFHTIVSAMKVGRRTLANIRKMIVYLLGTSAGEVLTMVMALVLGIPLPVAAIQILWINLVTDGVSVIPLGLSPAESRHMQQVPRDPRASLLNGQQVIRIIVMAAVMCTSVLVLFTINLDKGVAYAQTLAFLGLIVAQWANAFNVNYEYKSWVYNLIKPNKKLWLAVGFSIVLQLVIFMTPFGGFLHVVPVAFADALLAIILPVFSVLLAVDLHKYVMHLLHKRRKNG